MEDAFGVISIRDEWWVPASEWWLSDKLSSAFTHILLRRLGFRTYRALVAGLCIIYDLCRNCSILCLHPTGIQRTALPVLSREPRLASPRQGQALRHLSLLKFMSNAFVKYGKLTSGNTDFHASQTKTVQCYFILTTYNNNNNIFE